MSLQDYHAAIRKLRENGIEILPSVSASADDIAAIEQRLNIQLPPSYKAMLAEFGNMTFEGVEIYGWTRSGLNAKGVPDVISLSFWIAWKLIVKKRRLSMKSLPAALHVGGTSLQTVLEAFF